MGLMDQFNQGAPTGGYVEGTFAKAQDRASLWVNKTPFEVTSEPVMRAKRPEFVQKRADGSMPDPNEWILSIRLLDYRGDGIFGYVLQDDGEGGQAAVDLLLSFSCGPQRNYVMQRLGEYVKEHRSAGPFRLDKGQAQGKGQPPWVLVDWQPATPIRQVVEIHNTGTDPGFGADLYQYEEQAGVRYRWKAGMPAWEVVPAPAAPLPLPPPLPAGPPPLPVGDSQAIQAQPIPATQIIQGLATTEGMPSAAVRIERADGSQMRQASYLGDGVVQQPSGVTTQNAAGPEPRTREEAGGTGPLPNPPGVAAQTPNLGGGALGVEPAPSLPPGAPQPPQQAAQTTLAQAYQAGTPVGVTLHCDACHKPISTPAFLNPRSGQWLQAHQCPGVKKMRNLDATEAVKAAAGVVG